MRRRFVRRGRGRWVGDELDGSWLRSFELTHGLQLTVGLRERSFCLCPPGLCLFGNCIIDGYSTSQTLKTCQICLKGRALPLKLRHLCLHCRLLTLG